MYSPENQPIVPPQTESGGSNEEMTEDKNTGQKQEEKTEPENAGEQEGGDGTVKNSSEDGGKNQENREEPESTEGSQENETNTESQQETEEEKPYDEKNPEEKRKEIESYKTRYAGELEFGDNFTAENCTKKEEEIKEKLEEYGIDVETLKTQDDFLKALNYDHRDSSRLDAVSAVTDLFAEKARLLADFCKVEYLLMQKEYSGMKNGSEREQKEKDFMDKLHPNLTATINNLEKCIELNQKIKAASSLSGEEPTGDTQKKPSLSTPVASEESSNKAWEKVKKIGGGALLLSAAGLIWILKHFINGEKIDKLMEKVTGKKVPGAAKSKTADKK